MSYLNFEYTKAVAYALENVGGGIGQDPATEVTHLGLTSFFQCTQQISTKRHFKRQFWDVNKLESQEINEIYKEIFNSHPALQATSKCLLILLSKAVLYFTVATQRVYIMKRCAHTQAILLHEHRLAIPEDWHFWKKHFVLRSGLCYKQPTHIKQHPIGCSLQKKLCVVQKQLALQCSRAREPTL